MQSIWQRPRWSPYAVGAAIGVLSWITFALMGKALGTSTSLVMAAGAAERLVAPEHVADNVYLAKHLGTAAAPKPVVDWQLALVLMLAVGAVVAARLVPAARRAGPETVPALWQWRFGPSRWRRYAAAFGAGVVLLFGARLADGCTSGHAISGSMQLAVSSWVFTLVMFVSGAAAAHLLFGREGRNHVG